MPLASPLVSIIVGNYNYEQFVAAAVDSALQQTYPKLEVIVIDDGSTDGSRPLLEQYRDKVQLIFKENGGPTTTIHAGWAAARGEIVMFLDADDMLRADAVEKIVAAWRPDIVKLQFPLTVVDRDGRPKGFVPACTRALDARQIDRLVRRWGIYPTPPTSGNAYARRLLEQLLPLDTRRFPYGVDGALNAVAPLYGAVVSLGVSLGCYRVHGTNLWAGAPLDAERFRAYITIGRDEANFVREHAALRGIRLSSADPLDHSLVFLERRLTLKKLDPAHPMSRDDRPLRLFLKLCCCVGVYERGLLRCVVTLAWFLATTLAPPRLAMKLLAYRYVPAGRPAVIDHLVKSVRQNAEPAVCEKDTVSVAEIQ